MKTVKRSLVALLLALCMVLSLIACDIPISSPSESSSSEATSSESASSQEQLKAEGLAFLAIDINPSIEIVLEDGLVKSVNACNDDASVLLSGENLIGLTSDEATEKIVALAEELGYLNDDNNGVKITVTADDEDIASAIEEFAKEAVKKGSSRAIVNTNPRLADEREVKELKDENPEFYKNLSPAKLRLVKSIMEFDPDMTIEVGIEMSTEELLTLLKEYSDEFEGMVSEELRKQFKERKHAMKEEAKQRIEELYGEDYNALSEKLDALKALYEEVEAKAVAVELSSEDVQAILALIDNIEADIYVEDDVATIESIELYFDESFGPEFFEIKDELYEILKKYDKHSYALSEDEIAQITELCGETSATTLGDLKMLIKRTEAELRLAKDAFKPDMLEQIIIDEMEKRFDEIEVQIKEDLKEEMENARTHFETQKQHRHEQNERHNEPHSK